MLHKKIPYRIYQRQVHINRKLKILKDYYRSSSSRLNLGKLDKGKVSDSLNDSCFFYIERKSNKHIMTRQELRILEKMNQEIRETV